MQFPQDPWPVRSRNSLLKAIRVLKPKRSEKLVLRGSFRHYLRVVFLGNDAKTRKLLDELNDSLKNEQSYVIAATYANGKYVLDRVGTIEQVTSSNARTLHDVHEALAGNHRYYQSLSAC